MTVEFVYDDRRSLTKDKTAEELRALGGIPGLMCLDLRLCHEDSAALGRDENLPAILDWLPNLADKAWLAKWLSNDHRKARIEEMEECAEAGEWHELSCLLSGWHDELSDIRRVYASWNADAPRRNAQRKRRKTQEPGVSWQRELAGYLVAEGPDTRRAKYWHIPDEHQEALVLCDGKFAVTRRIGNSRTSERTQLIRCEFDDGRRPEEISFSTFERYLKEAHRP